MRNSLFGVIILLMVFFFYHQYRYADPYDAVLRQEPVAADAVVENLARWRYHDYVSFEWVPDAFTTAFKRLGIGGWSETGHRVCVSGCPYWTEQWTDGFYTVDLEIQNFAIDAEPERTFAEPRFMDVEIWGSVRSTLATEERLPQVGRRTRICGPLRIDRPYHVYTIQPDTADDIQNLDSCSILSKRKTDAVDLVLSLSCEQLRQSGLSNQIAIIDALADARESQTTTAAIVMAIDCVPPAVLDALSTNQDVASRLISLAPSIQSQLPALPETALGHEGTPVLNTIRDLWGQ